MNRIIGITGGIASGKSTVSAMITEMGYTVVDADVAARAVVEPGQKAYGTVVEQFGRDILCEDGTLNRAKLGGIIFHDEEKRLLLNSIVHPAVREYMDEQRDAAFARGESVVFMDIPLLFESKLQGTVDQSILVYVDYVVQLKRLMERNGFSEEEAKARIRSQMPLEDKKAMADAVIENNGSIEETKEQIRHILHRWSII
ncbi:dephospho-CoA kinase [Bacillus sp. 1P06AnD]|uniref:dephospho-CoA kinase n=1 Tax=Bacillus sp. 1P06AnD TaxID=3132208 RepID=UPI0039A1521D